MKVDATALFVKTMYVVFKNNAVVYKNNAVASTFLAYQKKNGWKQCKKSVSIGLKELPYQRRTAQFSLKQIEFWTQRNKGVGAVRQYNINICASVSLCLGLFKKTPYNLFLWLLFLTFAAEFKNILPMV